MFANIYRIVDCSIHLFIETVTNAYVSAESVRVDMHSIFTLPYSQHSYLQGVLRHDVNPIFRNLLENSLRILN